MYLPLFLNSYSANKRLPADLNSVCHSPRKGFRGVEPTTKTVHPDTEVREIRTAHSAATAPTPIRKPLLRPCAFIF